GGRGADELQRAALAEQGRGVDQRVTRVGQAQRALHLRRERGGAARVQERAHLALAAEDQELRALVAVDVDPAVRRQREPRYQRLGAREPGFGGGRGPLGRGEEQQLQRAGAHRNLTHSTWSSASARTSSTRWPARRTILIFASATTETS